MSEPERRAVVDEINAIAANDRLTDTQKLNAVTAAVYRDAGLEPPPPRPEPPKPLRAPVQGDHLRREPPGSIDWAVHLRAFETYVRCYGRSQSAEVLAARGGFGQGELRCLLAGHDPLGCHLGPEAHAPIPTWSPR